MSVGKASIFKYSRADLQNHNSSIIPEATVVVR